MAKVTPLNSQEAAKGKRIYTKAEYAVREALNVKRLDSGAINSPINHISSKWDTHEKVNFRGSVFMSTDQMADHYMGEEFFTRSSRYSVFDDMNINKDIDLILSNLYSLGGMKAVKGQGCTISVKKMDAAMKTGNVSLEIRSFNPDTGEERIGWAVAGKSDFTAICIGHKAILVKTSELHMLRDDDEYEKKEHLRADIIDMNREQGRYFIDAENILIPVKDVMALPSAQILDLPKWYCTAWNRNEFSKPELNKTFWGE